MAGNKEGAKKAALTNKKKYGKDFYKKIGAKSWKNPNRSRETGFALKTPEQRAEAGRKGGLKTKDEYKTTKTNQTAQKTPEGYDSSQEVWEQEEREYLRSEELDSSTSE